MICDYCPHQCNITSQYHGICHTKSLSEGTITTRSYGQITSIALDPIEKKPLAKYMPGSKILSIGSWGCNMFCPWCQNDSISRGPADFYNFTPDDIVNEAIKYIPNGNIGIAYTYNEMLTNYDFVLETANLAKEKGLKNVLVTNGLIADKYIKNLAPVIDALNIDLKTIYPDKYQSIGGNLDTILKSITEFDKYAHVEVTTLIVTDFNDSVSEMELLSDTLAGINRDIPLHITRFFPSGNYRHVPATDINLIYKLKDIASQKLSYVFTGNIY